MVNPQGYLSVCDCFGLEMLEIPVDVTQKGGTGAGFATEVPWLHGFT